MFFAFALACSTPEPAAKPAQPASLTPVRVALNWYAEPEFGGFYAAVEDGLYKKAGLEVTLSPGGPGVPVLEMLAANNTDVAISGADDLLLRRAKGLDAVAVYAGFQDSPVGLLVHDPGPGTFADISGQVAVEVGSPFQRFLWAKMAWDGRVEAVPSTGTLGAFSASPALSQQAYITSEPCIAEEKSLATRFLAARDVGWNPYGSLAVVRGKDDAAPWVKAFVEASTAGWKAYLADPARANIEIAKANPEMTPLRLRCIVDRQKSYVTGKDGLGVVRQERLDELAAVLVSVGQEAKAEGARGTFAVTAPSGPPFQPAAPATPEAVLAP